MRRVLVVDDSATVRQQVTVALEEAGYETVEAVDGLDGVEKIATDASIAAVICDVNMPRMDGLSLLETLQRQAGRWPPILMLTTETKPELMLRAKAAGAKGWILKPFKAEFLVAAVGKLVGV